MGESKQRVHLGTSWAPGLSGTRYRAGGGAKGRGEAYLRDGGGANLGLGYQEALEGL